MQWNILIILDLSFFILAKFWWVLESMTFSSAFNFNKVYCGGARFYNTLQNVGAGVHLTSTHGSHDFQQSA